MSTLIYEENFDTGLGTWSAVQNTTWASNSLRLLPTNGGSTPYTSRDATAQHAPTVFTDDTGIVEWNFTLRESINVTSQIQPWSVVFNWNSQALTRTYNTTNTPTRYHNSAISDVMVVSLAYNSAGLGPRATFHVGSSQKYLSGPINNSSALRYVRVRLEDKQHVKFYIGTEEPGASPDWTSSFTLGTPITTLSSGMYTAAWTNTGGIQHYLDSISIYSGGTPTPPNDISVWNGSSWKPAQQWNGVSWVDISGTTTRWNGSSWESV